MAPPARYDITKSLIGQLKKNGAVARRKGARFNDMNVLSGFIAKMIWFKGMVKNKAPWDLKYSVYKGYRKSGVDVCGVHYQLDMTGNLHYGFVGAAAQIADIILHEAAGYAQNRAGTSKPEYYCTADDDPRDYEFIRLGIKLFDDFGLHFSQENLKSVLKGYSPKSCKMYEFQRLPFGGYIRQDGLIGGFPAGKM
jgi:Bacterial toxin 44